MIIAGTGSCKRAMAVQVDVDPAWPVPGTNTWHCGHCTPAAELEAAFAWRLLWHIALALAEHTGLGLGWCPHATRGARSAATAPVLWACGGTAAALYCDWAVLVAAARRPAQPDAADREWRSQVEVAGPCRPRPWPVEPQLQPHTESPSPRGRYVGEASRLMRAVIGNSEGPREKKSIRNYNSNSGTRRRYQLYTCTCRHV